MIKILYALNGVFHKGGTEAVVLNYFNNIDKNTFHIDFLVHGYEKDCINNEVHNYLKSCGSKIYYVTPRGVNYFKNKSEINSILSSNSYDIVHSHMDAAGAFLLKIAKKNNIKLKVSHSHNTNNQINKGSFIKNFLYKIVLNSARKSVNKYADLRLACSREAGKWLYGDNDFIVINNAIDVNKFVYDIEKRIKIREKLNYTDELVIGHVGRFSMQKNHEFLIDIFAELAKQNDKAKLLLVGSGELESNIIEKVNKLKLKDKVNFLGNRSDVYELMQGMDIFLLPSLFEGLPVVAVEAQASGLPCVISNNVSPDVSITDLVTLLPLSLSAKEWALSINNLAKSITRVNQTESLVKAGYEITSIVDKLSQLYLEKLNNE